MRKHGISTAVLAALILTLGLSFSALAASDSGAAKAASEAAQYIYGTVEAPQVGSVGGEWAVIGLARSGYNAPEKYYRDYYGAVEAYVSAKNGVLHDKKYTEYSRVITALSAIGADARHISGYDLTYPLGDFDKTVRQGLNGAVWALIALDSRGYPMPENKEAKTQATRQMYIDLILDRQNSDGGWSISKGGASDTDITGMALQALSGYQTQSAVKSASDRALAYLSMVQSENGGYALGDAECSESCAQVITALCELGISPDDSRFVKNGNTLLVNLLSFRMPDGGFRHLSSDTSSNQMASEQALYALAAAKRLESGQSSLYRMSDAASLYNGGADYRAAAVRIGAAAGICGLIIIRGAFLCAVSL